LVRARRASGAPPARARTRHAFEHRLKSRRPLDETLTAFGLSPHPRLVLVLEGDTELALFPRVMGLFDITTDDDFISIQNAEGVKRDLSPLVAFVAPRVEEEEGERYLKLLRPPTRVLVVFDPEGPFTSADTREERRKVWVNRIQRTLPAEHRTLIISRQIDQLVHVATWNRRGESFEFAHFTDRELAKAILATRRRGQPPTLDRMTQHVAAHRRRRGNLKTLLKGDSKLALADELWPALERKIDRARRANTVTRVPVVRVLDEALALANELPRRNLVLALHE
jgi:hypothetical protein